MNPDSATSPCPMIVVAAVVAGFSVQCLLRGHMTRLGAFAIVGHAKHAAVNWPRDAAYCIGNVTGPLSAAFLVKLHLT